MRCEELFQRIDYFSTYMDVMMPLTGGGTLHYRNDLEKMFFVILLLGAFFMNAIGTDNFLFYTFLTEVTNLTDTLETVAEFNLPINLGNAQVGFVEGMLEYDFWARLFNNSFFCCRKKHVSNIRIGAIKNIDESLFQMNCPWDDIKSGCGKLVTCK